jgi:diacylglycerol kinase family enzyme
MSGEFAGKVVRELGASLDLRTEQTGYRGHAGRLAAEAVKLGYELVVTFGGDGTVNEVVNGLMSPDTGSADTVLANTAQANTVQANTVQRVGAGLRPALAVVPGGDGNVFARTLGIPIEPPAAAAHIVRVVRSGASTRVIGLSLAHSADLPQPRYFTFSAGLGLDAEVVADVERARRAGQQSSTLLYMRTALRRYYTATDRSKPALTLHVPGQTPTTGLFMGVVTNSSPWTYLGGLPVLVVPHERTDLNSGLDVFGLRRMRTLTSLYTLHQMMHSDSKPPTGPDVLTMAELSGLAFSAIRPIAFHIDGEYLGETEQVSFTFVPDALRVIA